MTCVKFFNRSSCKIKIFQDFQKEKFDIELKLIKPTDIRWMSKFNVVERVLLLYPAIVQTLTILVRKGYLDATCILLELKKIRNIAHLAIISDISFIVEPLNQTLQYQELNLEQIEGSLALTLSKLEELSS